MMNFEPGGEIDQYRVIRPLGQGGMGAVYEVEHVKLGVHYALKTFTLEEGHVDLFRNRFLAEGKVAARFGIPNNSVAQIKTRVEKMIAAIEAEYKD